MTDTKQTTHGDDKLEIEVKPDDSVRYQRLAPEAEAAALLPCKCADKEEVTAEQIDACPAFYREKVAAALEAKQAKIDELLDKEDRLCEEHTNHLNQSVNRAREEQAQRLQNCRDAYEGCCAERDQLQAEIDTQIAANRVLGDGFNKMQTALAAARAEIDTLNQKLAARKRIVNQLQEATDRQDAAIAKLEEENEGLRQRLREAEKFAHWFSKYPEFKPNPEMIDEVVADRDAWLAAERKEKGDGR